MADVVFDDSDDVAFSYDCILNFPTSLESMSI